MPAQARKMMVATVDANDRPVAKVARRDALRLGASFRVVHVFVVNQHDEVLLQQISRDHDRHPLWWGASVAGYVAANESYADAATRKLKTELAITKRPKLVGKTQMRDDQSQKFITVYALRWDGPISPNPTDFAAIQFCSLKQILSKPETLKLRLTPTFKHIVQHLREPLEQLLES
jgi:isopentenyldiphosphate isomerase